jgi:hypothetical protein
VTYLNAGSRDSSVGIYGLDDRGYRVRFPTGAGIFLFTTTSRPAPGPTQPPIQWVPGALSLGVKRQGREADHSPPSSAEVKSTWSYNSTPQYAFMAWCSVKAQGQLYLLPLSYLNANTCDYLYTMKMQLLLNFHDVNAILCMIILITFTFIIDITQCVVFRKFPNSYIIFYGYKNSF